MGMLFIGNAGTLESYGKVPAEWFEGLHELTDELWEKSIAVNGIRKQLALFSQEDQNA